MYMYCIMLIIKEVCKYSSLHKKVAYIVPVYILVIFLLHVLFIASNL